MIQQIRDCLSLLNAPARRRLLLLIVLVFINTVLEVLSVGMVVPFIALLNRPELVETNPFAHRIYLALGLSSPQELLLAAGVALFFLVIFKNIYLYQVVRAQYRFAFNQSARISGLLFNRYLHAPFWAHLQRNSSELVLTADYSVDNVALNSLMAILTIATEASAVLGIVALMLFAEPGPTAALIAVLGACGLALIVLLRRRLVTISEHGLSLRMLRMRTLTQALTAIKELKIFGREQFFKDQFQEVRDRLAVMQADEATLGQAPRMVIEGIVVGGLMGVIVLILLQGRPAAEIMGVLGLFAMAAFRIMPGVNRVFVAYNAMKSSKAYLDSVVGDMNNPDLIARPESAEAGALDFRQEIAFRDLHFTYRNAAGPALAGISFAIGRGESVGLVGTSGAGKSTLVDLLMGLLEPSGGRITIDGRDVAGDVRKWRRLVGYVPQSISLIDDSLRNNVAFGIPAAEIDDIRVWQVLKMARLEALVRGMPDGLDTLLGERGARLSGGERQRVGIARALYHDPQVLVFDEATSALDNESEHEITKAIEALRGQKTMLVIAHRLSTVKSCDRLVLMRGGCIAETGDFATLMARSPDFRRMVQLTELTGGDTAPSQLH